MTLLTDIDELPGALAVIYDGGCRFCEAQMRTVARLDWRRQVGFISLFDARVAERYPALEREDLLRQIYVVELDGRPHGGIDGIRLLTRRMPLLWWLAPLLHFPGTLPLWRGLYRFVARRRYWFGRIDCHDGMCQLP